MVTKKAEEISKEEVVEAEAESKEETEESKSLEEKKKELLKKAAKLKKKLVEEAPRTEELKEQVKAKKKGEMLIHLDEYVRAGIYLGTKVVTPSMRPFVYRRRADGLAIFNTDLIDEKLKEGIEFLSKFVNNLTGAGLINKIEYDGKNTFVITPKGRQYLESYTKFQGIADSFGLDL